MQDSLESHSFNQIFGANLGVSEILSEIEMNNWIKQFLSLMPTFIYLSFTYHKQVHSVQLKTNSLFASTNLTTKVTLPMTGKMPVDPS